MVSKNYFFIEEINDFIEKVKLLNKVVCLDYESSGLNHYSKSFSLAGIGFSDSENGYYLIINSIEKRNLITNEINEKIKNLFEYLSSKHLLVCFNKKYEIPVTKAVFNYDIKLVDVMIMSLCLDDKAGLKKLSRKHLNVEIKEVVKENLDEDELVEEAEEIDLFWDEDVKVWVNSLSGIVSSFIQKTEKPNKHYLSFLDQYNLMKETGILIKPESKLKGLTTSFDSLFSLIEKKISDDRKQLIINSLFETIITKVNNNDSEKDYTLVPYEIVYEYCIEDCKNTCKLFSIFVEQFKTLKLGKAYESYSGQTDLAIDMEQAGCSWDSLNQEKYLVELNKHLLYYMKKLILNKRFVEKMNLTDIQILEVETTTDYDYLCTYINPRSIKTREIIEKVVMSVPVRIAWMLKSSEELIRNRSKYNESIITKIKPLLDKEYNGSEDLLSTIPQLGPIVRHYRESRNFRERKFFESQLDLFTLPGFDGKKVIPKFFKIFKKYFKIDFSKEESFYSIPEVEFFVDLFLCKKVSKEISAFYSKLGLDKVHDKILLNDEDFICDKKFIPEFKVNSVVTRRWSSGFHTSGANSHIKDCIESTYGDNGLILSFDSSQAEVRTLAMFAEEELLLQAYRDGLDVHRFNAHKMTGKPMEEITSAERSVAKAMTFGILYGKSPSTMYEDGDFNSIEEATKAFDDFYTAYPKINEWTKKQQETVLKEKKVYTYYGDFIKIDFDETREDSIAEAKRKAGNYPIQHYSSCANAIVCKELNQYYRTNNLNCKAFAFIHDASYFNLHVKDLFNVMLNLKSLAIKFFKDKTNLEMDIDINLGINLGDKLEVKIISEKEFEITGLKDSLIILLDKLKNNYDLTYSFEDTGTKKLTYDEMWLKSSYNIYLNKEKITSSLKIKLD